MAALLSFAIKDDVILAIRAIKKPDPRYVQEVFTNAGIADLHNQFSHETGWSVTLPEHRCKGLSGTLLKELITKIDANVYSTTRVSNKAPQKILERTGFVQTGKEFSGREESLILWLYEPEQNWEEEIYEKEGCLGI
jgi:predicted GNAT family acetyltransferase